MNEPNANKSNHEQVTVRIEKDMMDKIRQLARKDKRSVSSMIRVLMEKGAAYADH